MRKKDIIDAVRRELGYKGTKKHDIIDIFNSIFNQIEYALLRGESVRLIGLGELYINRERNRGKTNSNSLSEQYFLRFKTSKVFRAKLKEYTLKELQNEAEQ